MKVHIARDGEILGEWTQTALYKLLRTSEIFPSDYYWHEGMSEWRHLAELPCGKSVLATPAQHRLLDDCELPWDEFTTRYDVSRLLDSRPCTDKQRAFMDDLGIEHFDGMTTKEASDLIDLELARETSDGPARSKQLETLRYLAALSNVNPTIPASPSRRTVAGEIDAIRCVSGIPRKL